MSKDIQTIFENIKTQYGDVTSWAVWKTPNGNNFRHTELWKKHKAKDPAKGYGTMVAGKYWHWYERWVDVVRKHCQDHREVYA